MPAGMASHTSKSSWPLPAQVIADEYGLAWLLVLVVPESVFLGNLPQTRDTLMGIVIAVTLLIGLVLFSITCVVTNALVSLGKDMGKVRYTLTRQ